MNDKELKELFQKIITLSLKTQEIIKDLPDLELS